MSLKNIFDPSAEEEIPRSPAEYADRSEIVKSLADNPLCDILVVGGGIHGACVAHCAAFNGFRTVLLEASDYAGATSSRSSKMAHGGLRYLEFFDLVQVYKGLKAREDLFKTAKHIVHPHDFLIPVKSTWFRLKLALGLTFYDLLVADKTRRSNWNKLSELPAQAKAGVLSECLGGYSYCDGLMNDTRLVIERIVAARSEGARCLNYARVNSVKSDLESVVRVGWQDALSNEKHELRAGVVFNCTGPWVPTMGRLKPSALAEQIRYSRGTHLLFDQVWEGPALLLPLGPKSSYYFVWPHEAGTLVGTTEREVHQLPNDPEPSRDEIEEILARVERDLPNSGLNRSSLHYAFAGIRTLPKRGKSGSTELLSRRSVWIHKDGVMTLLGGKFTTAASTAYQGLRKALSLAYISEKMLAPLDGRLLPGCGLLEKIKPEYLSKAAEAGVPQRVVERTIARYGSRVRFFMDRAGAFELIGGVVLRGEVEFVIESEQVENLEDLLRRRLELEYHKGHGLEIVEDLAEILGKYRPELDIKAEVDRYRQRIQRLTSSLKV